MGYRLIDWVDDYLENAGRFPVLPDCSPGQIKERLPKEPPRQGESMEDIFRDFETLIMPGITHWNHPRFFAYFPANNSPPSVLAELLSAGLGVNAMLWQTSPAATELEELVMDWLRQMIGLPDEFRGSIQDTASTATLCALVCAREQATDHSSNQAGLTQLHRVLRVYTSSEAHSSVEKGARIAGFGSENVVKVAVDETYAMDPQDLQERIKRDRDEGLQPCCVVATVGTTSSTALDPLRPIGEIAGREGLWLHVDAALAGSAAILPEKRHILDGVELADSFVFNPHKWLFTNFDCSAFFCRDPHTLVRTFSITPEYLKTAWDQQAINYRDWGIQLGRRFRALKLWFVIRTYGVEGLQDRLRQHLRLAQMFKGWVEEDPDFELLAPVPLQTVCFRFNPKGCGGLPAQELDKINESILNEVNRSGRIFMTHTRLSERYSLRLSIGQTLTTQADVEEAWRVINETKTARKWRG
jgi:aromatic-L-amino-acid decarboxylase